MDEKEQIEYNKGILTSTLEAVNSNIEKLKSEIFFLYDETNPDDETKNELDFALAKLSETQDIIGNAIEKNKSDDGYVGYIQ